MLVVITTIVVVIVVVVVLALRIELQRRAIDSGRCRNTRQIETDKRLVFLRDLEHWIATKILVFGSLRDPRVRNGACAALDGHTRGERLLGLADVLIGDCALFGATAARKGGHRRGKQQKRTELRRFEALCTPNHRWILRRHGLSL